MSIIAAKPIRTLHLDFVADDRKKLVRGNLSAVATRAISSGSAPMSARCWIA